MLTRVGRRVGVALLGAAIAVVLNLTLLACSTITSTGAATGATGSPGTGTPTLSSEFHWSDDVMMPAHGPGQATALCPDDTVVAGGGFTTASEIIFASQPDAVHHGWYVHAYNNNDQPKLLKAYVVCLRLTQ